MDFSEKWGKDVDEAVRLALIDLNLTIDDVVVKVLEEPTKGFFGIGSKLAKVRVERKIQEPVKEEIIKRDVPSERAKPSAPPARPKSENRRTSDVKADHERKGSSESKPAKRDKREERPKRTRELNEEGTFTLREKPADLEELANSPAENFLKEISVKMGLNLDVKVYGNENCIYIDMSGKDSGTIIGKRGQTLDSIQYLTSLVVNKDKEKYIRVVVDAENYRQKRERTLEQLANRLADKVIKTRKSVRLEPMNPYERKVIHATLQQNSSVTTRSEGEEPYRRVIIELK